MSVQMLRSTPCSTCPFRIDQPADQGEADYALSYYPGDTHPCNSNFRVGCAGAEMLSDALGKRTKSADYSGVAFDRSVPTCSTVSDFESHIIASATPGKRENSELGWMELEGRK